jgi:hypothetical protein
VPYGTTVNFNVDSFDGMSRKARITVSSVDWAA